MQKSCKHCGDTFLADKDWKTMCIPCYIKWKKASDEPEIQKKIEIVQVYEVIPDDILARLIRLCHPDKHKNSVASTEATQWLLRVRDIQRDSKDKANEQ